MSSSTTSVQGCTAKARGDAHPAEEVVALIRENGGEAAVNGDDISSWAGGKNVVEQAIDTFGSLDILVNNAGILRDKMSFNMDESDWDDVIRVHLKGHFAATHHAAVYWRNRAKGGEEVAGRIINTTSESGLFGNAGQANYAAAKAGIAALTLVEARELGRYGVTSNAVAPRARTRMTETLFGSEGMGAEEGAFDAWDPKNIANVVAFLAAPASADISGQILVVFGASIWAMSAYQAVGRVTRDTAWTPRGADRRQGRAVHGHQLGRPALQLHLTPTRTLPPERRARPTVPPEPPGRGALRYGGGVVTEQALGVGGATPVGHEPDTPVEPPPTRRRRGLDLSPSRAGPGTPTARRPGAPRGRRLWVDWRRPVTIAVGATIGFRLVVTWVALVSEYTVSFPHLVARHPSVLWDVLAKWDGGYYLSLAAHGYPAHSATAAANHAGLAFYAFGPLYPVLISVTHAVTGLAYEPSAELASTAALAVALAAMWKLLELDLGVRSADAACVMLLAWPSAFFLVATYPESVTLAAVTLSFLTARRGHFVAAGLLAALAVAGKSYLVVLLVALAMEVWSTPATGRRGGRARTWSGCRRCGSPPGGWWRLPRQRSPSSWPGSPTSAPASTSGSRS